MKDQVTTEFTHAYVEMPPVHAAMWWRSMGVVVDLVRQMDALGVASGAITILAVDKRIPIFTLSLAQVATGAVLGERGWGVSDKTHYATSRAVQGRDQGVDEVNSKVI